MIKQLLNSFIAKYHDFCVNVSQINYCSDEQKSVKKNLVKFGTRYIRFMLRTRQPLKLLSDACTESRSVACVFYSCEK